MAKTDIIGEHPFRRRREKESEGEATCLPLRFSPWPLRIAIPPPIFGLGVAKTERWQSASDAWHPLTIVSSEACSSSERAPFPHINQLSPLTPF